MVTTTHAALPTGATIGAYRIDEVLGAGAWTITYRATDQSTREPVALREFFPELLCRRAEQGPEVLPVSDVEQAELSRSITRFMRWARTVATVRHDNVAMVRRVMEINGTAYLATRLIDGAPLDALIRPGEQLDPLELEEILPGMLAGLDAIHRAGLYHRSIHPGAIFINREAAPVLDLPTADWVVEDPDVELATHVRAYASPELLVREDFANSSDIYSLCATLFRLVTGQPPPAADARAFPDRDRPDTIAHMLADSGVGWRPLLLDVIARGMALSPRARPPSVADMRAFLDQRVIEEPETVPTRPHRRSGGARAQRTEQPPPPQTPLPEAPESKKPESEKPDFDRPTAPRRQRNAGLELDRPTRPTKIDPPATGQPAKPAEAEQGKQPPTGQDAPGSAAKPEPKPDAAPGGKPGPQPVIKPRAAPPGPPPAPSGDAASDAPTDAPTGAPGGPTAEPVPDAPKKPPAEARPGSPADRAGDATRDAPDKPPADAPDKPRSDATPNAPAAPPDEPRNIGGPSSIVYRGGKPESVDPPASGKDGGQATPANIAPARFTLYHPEAVGPRTWGTLIVYLHESGIASLIAAQETERREGPLTDRAQPRDDTNMLIRPGADMLVVPQLRGGRVNPPFARVQWVENFHRLEFRIAAAPDATPAGGQALEGSVTIFAGSLLVGETPFNTAVAARPKNSEPVISKSMSFSRVFPSFAGDDKDAVERFATAAESVNMPYLKKILELRALGKDRAVRRMIQRAERYQLCWSGPGSVSAKLRREWEEAKGLNRDDFIRITSWARPMPAPPAELTDAPVQRLPLLDE